jgi:hypothetical protein
VFNGTHTLTRVSPTVFTYPSVGTNETAGGTITATMSAHPTFWADTTGNIVYCANLAFAGPTNTEGDIHSGSGDTLIIGSMTTQAGVTPTFGGTAGSTANATGRKILSLNGLIYRTNLDLAYFSATKNGASQTGIGTVTATKVTFGTATQSSGSFYSTANSRWTPPAGLVELTATYYISAGLTSSGVVEAYIYKNGSLLKAVTDIVYSATGGISITAIDVANGTDYYEAWVYLTTASTGTIDGLVDYTYFMGRQC